MRFLAVLLAACTSPAQPQKRVERRSPTHVQPLQRKEVEPEAKPRVILHTELREPFWQVVRASLQSYIVTTSETKVRACVYFNADGTVGGTRVRRSGDDELDAAAERALAGLEQAWRLDRHAAAVRDAAQGLVNLLSGTVPHTPSDPRVLRAIDHVRDRPGETVTLEDVASLAGLSPSRFRHLFVEQTGMPLRTYQLWRRLLRVWDYLMEGETLAQAAHAAGFADSAHLSRTCRTMFGLAPSALQMSGPLRERARPSAHHAG